MWDVILKKAHPENPWKCNLNRYHSTRPDRRIPSPSKEETRQTEFNNSKYPINVTLKTRPKIQKRPELHLKSTDASKEIFASIFRVK
jgi:hypothetical protein